MIRTELVELGKMGAGRVSSPLILRNRNLPSYKDRKLFICSSQQETLICTFEKNSTSKVC